MIKKLAITAFAGLSALGFTAISAAEDIIDYGNQCAAAIAQIPAFNCLDGEIIPITVGGKTPDSYFPGMDCDRPSLLPLGPESDGQCVPFSRALLISDDNAQITALCRQKKIRTADSPYFDEIDIIAHDVVTGSTCWFQAEAKDANGFDATRVPPPNEVSPPPGHVSARAFWNSPEKTASADCGDCHDSDPFMYSPFIGQVWHQVPTDPFGWYANDIGEAFRKWAKPKSITTRGNTCIGCHRIGSEFTCRQGILESAGVIHPQNGDDWALDYPGSHWMPAGNFHSKEAWDTIYKKSVSDLASCCSNPDQPSCQLMPITGRP
ncbi:hypothetical protein [Aestuariispira insulae]|uniref:Uncharacterized protein n=1 Tax=Aestuariispira insulae TaxID=1461337 RepID=A0A3D9HMV6_9PROT|nr:hypothetical protein [Aestuariispira insulae]RED50824.1 hypothetical protein DFP90_10496 [Aestuariispira insulae]